MSSNRLLQASTSCGCVLILDHGETSSCRLQVHALLCLWLPFKSAALFPEANISLVYLFWRVSVLRFTNETMRIVMVMVIGAVLGFYIGISFPTVSITKVWWWLLSSNRIFFIGRNGVTYVCLECASCTFHPALFHMQRREALTSRRKPCLIMPGLLPEIQGRIVLSKNQIPTLLWRYVLWLVHVDSDTDYIMVH
jgi:hypothetical protein